MVKWSRLSNLQGLYSHFCTRSTILQGIGGIPSVTTTVKSFGGSTTECSAKVSTRIIGAELIVVLSDTVGVVTLREGSTGNAAWTSEGVPVMEHDTV